MLFTKENIEKGIKELINTFSDKPSFLSSKRIERFAIFSSMLIATLIFLSWRILNCNVFGATDLMIVVTGWMMYAGFNTIQSNKNKTNNEEKSDISNSDTSSNTNSGN